MNTKKKKLWEEKYNLKKNKWNAHQMRCSKFSFDFENTV